VAPAFTRADHLVWAGASLAFATLVTLPLMVVLRQLEVCAQCGQSVFGSICSGSGYGTCDGEYGFLAAVLVLIAGGCLGFSLRILSAYRTGGAAAPQVPTPAVRGPALELGQTAALAIASFGGELVVAGALVPSHFLEVCIEPCTGGYALDGIPLATVLFGIVLAVVALTAFLLLRRAARADPAL
jgi:hypothetical protein